MFQHKVKFAILLGIIMISGKTHAQVMNLRECMEYAVVHAAEMRISAADRSDEQAVKRQAFLDAFTPNINAQTYAYNQYGRNLDPETNTYTEFTTFHNGYSLSGGITLFEGFQALNKIRIANVQQLLGLSQERQSADKVRIATMEAYYQVIYYTQLVEVLRLQTSTADSTLFKVQREEELGRKGHADVVQMESEKAQRQYQLVQAKGQLSQAMLSLKETMNWPADSILVVDNYNWSSRSTHDSLIIFNNPQFELPSVAIARAALRQAELQVKQAQGAWSPSLSLHVGWSTTYYTYPGMAGYQPLSFSEQWKSNGGENVQLSLTIPIYSRGQRYLALTKSKNEQARAQVRLEQAERERDNALRKIIDEVETARAAAIQSERMADVKRQAYTLSRRQYELGLISAIEYQNASDAYLNAETEHINAQLQLQLKEHQLNYYKTGELL